MHYCICLFYGLTLTAFGKNTDHTDKATRRSRLRTPFSRARGLSRFAPLAFGELLPQPLGRCFEKTGRWYKISNAQAAAAAARDCKERERRVAVCVVCVFSKCIRILADTQLRNSAPPPKKNEFIYHTTYEEIEDIS